MSSISLMLFICCRCRSTAHFIRASEELLPKVVGVQSGQTALAFVQPSNKISQELLEYLAAGSESVKYKFVLPIQ